MIKIKNNQIYSTSDKFIHRKGTETYFKKSFALPEDTIEDFEEVDELPKYTKAEYSAKVRELIKEKYSIEDEIALINNSKDGIEKHLDEYIEYLAYREECKTRAKEILNDGKEV